MYMYYQSCKFSFSKDPLELLKTTACSVLPTCQAQSDCFTVIIVVARKNVIGVVKSEANHATECAVKAMWDVFRQLVQFLICHSVMEKKI